MREIIIKLLGGYTAKDMQGLQNKILKGKKYKDGDIIPVYDINTMVIELK